MKSVLERANSALGLTLEEADPWALVSSLCSELERANSASVEKSDAWDAISEKNQIIKDQSTLITELVGALENINEIIKDSDGVAGFHLNGDVATWDGYFRDEVTDVEHALTKAKGSEK